ncbi:hypothetical protein JWG42_19650, partial [Desulfoprunum benzoelyticum]
MRKDATALAAQTPQIFLTSATLPDHELHARAGRLLAANIFQHRPLPADIATLGLESEAEADRLDPAAIRASLPAVPPSPRRPTRQTLALAMERLYGLGILDGPEMRHHASLAPWG